MCELTGLSDFVVIYPRTLLITSFVISHLISVYMSIYMYLWLSVRHWLSCWYILQCIFISICGSPYLYLKELVMKSK